MLELEKFGLVEMSSVEVKEVDGGECIWYYLNGIHNANKFIWKMGLGVLAGMGDGIRATY